jgi:hypothetical protein
MLRPVLLAGAALSAAALVSGCALGQATQATSVQGTSATLNGNVSAIESGPVEHWFQYGTTTAYGSTTPHRSLTVDDHDDHPVSEPVTGLSPQTTYHFRLCARNAGQTNPNCGGDKVFTTSDHDGARYYADRPDDHAAGTQQVHVLYVLPSNGTDRSYDTNGAIATSVGVATQWMSARTGGKPFRLDTVAGALDITFVRLGSTDAQLASHGFFIRDEIQRLLEQRGFDNGRKYYFVFYDGTANETCGGASWPPQLIGHVVAIYLKGQFANPQIPDCDTNPFAGPAGPAGYREFSFLHEIFHGLGAVPTCAPNHVLSGHTSDTSNDLMYAGSQPWQPTMIDLNNDDYWGHDIDDCPDISNAGYLVGNPPAPVPGEDIDGNPLSAAAAAHPRALAAHR